MDNLLYYHLFSLYHCFSFLTRFLLPPDQQHQRRAQISQYWVR